MILLLNKDIVIIMMWNRVGCYLSVFLFFLLFFFGTGLDGEQLFVDVGQCRQTCSSKRSKIHRREFEMLLKNSSVDPMEVSDLIRYHKWITKTINWLIFFFTFRFQFSYSCHFKKIPHQNLVNLNRQIANRWERLWRDTWLLRDCSKWPSSRIAPVCKNLNTVNVCNTMSSISLEHRSKPLSTLENVPVIAQKVNF